MPIRKHKNTSRLTTKERASAWLDREELWTLTRRASLVHMVRAAVRQALARREPYSKALGGAMISAAERWRDKWIGDSSSRPMEACFLGAVKAGYSLARPARRAKGGR